METNLDTNHDLANSTPHVNTLILMPWLRTHQRLQISRYLMHIHIFQFLRFATGSMYGHACVCASSCRGRGRDRPTNQQTRNADGCSWRRLETKWGNDIN